MKVAVIGAGGWGCNLIRTLHELNALGAVAEVDPERRAVVAARYPGIETVGEPSELWTRPLAGVVIATPAATHYELAKQALEEGKDVFVEKPITLSSEQAQELVDLARQRDRILFAGHLLLYQPAIQWLKKEIADGVTGSLLSVHLERLNLGRVRSIENALWSLGVHDIAILLYLVGKEPDRVVSVGQRALQPGIEDDVHVHLRFPGDLQGHLHASWLWPEKRRRLTIVGSKAMMVYDEVQRCVVLHRKRVGPELRVQDDGAEVVFEDSGDPLRVECEAFLDSVRTRRPPVSDGASAVQVLRVLERAQANLSMVD